MTLESRGLDPNYLKQCTTVSPKRSLAKWLSRAWPSIVCAFGPLQRTTWSSQNHCVGLRNMVETHQKSHSGSGPMQKEGGTMKRHSLSNRLGSVPPLLKTDGLAASPKQSARSTQTRGQSFGWDGFLSSSSISNHIIYDLPGIERNMISNIKLSYMDHHGLVGWCPKNPSHTFGEHT